MMTLQTLQEFLTRSAAILYLDLEKRWNGTDSVRVSLPDLMRSTGLIRRTLCRAKRDLEVSGFIVTVSEPGGRGRVATYERKGDILETGTPFPIYRNHIAPTGNDGSKGEVGMTKRKNVTLSENVTLSKKKSEKPEISIAHSILLYEKACGILGRDFNPNTAGARMARRNMRSRIREGFTQDQLLTAVEYAVSNWKNNRWAQWKNLSYVWGKNLEMVLDTKGEAGRKGQEAPQFRQGEEQKEWLADIDRRIAKDMEDFQKDRGQRLLGELEGVE